MGQLVDGTAWPNWGTARHGWANMNVGHDSLTKAQILSLFENYWMPLYLLVRIPSVFIFS